MIRVASTASLSLLLVAGTLGGAACYSAGNKPVPLDRAVFPLGLALSRDGGQLLVSSSDFDFTYDSGAVLLANVADIRADLLARKDAETVVVDAYVAGVRVPEFADRLVFVADGKTAIFTTREGNLLHAVDVDDDSVSCGDAALCNVSPNTLQLSGNDPFDVLVLSDDGVILRGLVSHLGSAQAEIFVLDRTRTDEQRLTIEVGALDFARAVDTSTGVRGAVERPARDGRGGTVIAAVERREEGVLVGVDLVTFATPGPGRANDAVFQRQDITTQLGTRSVRDMAIVDDGDGTDALIVLLQNPDGIARFAIDDDAHLTLSVLDNTCVQPLGLAVAALDTDGVAGVDVTRLIVACHGSDEVVALDPRTLRVTDTSRFYGRGPYDIVVDATNNVAWVSFFLDNSVGAYRLVDDDGGFRMTPIGRLGAALPRPEDGRE